MTSTAVRHGPSPALSRTGLPDADDAGLLALVKSEPVGSDGRTPDDAELLEARRADLFFHSPSLDAPVAHPGGQPDGLASLADVLGEEDPGLELATDMDAVSAHWTELSPRERRILLMRFYGNMTQAEIGTRLGISQMHVSRLQAAALSLLRDRLLGQGPAPAPAPPGGPALTQTSSLTQTRRQA